jgi:hypothetical protein
MATSPACGLLLAFATCAAPACAAVESRPSSPPDGSHVARTLAALDADISDAYNTCKLNRLRRHFSPLAELYFADRGHSTRVGELIDDARRNVCGKLRRETVPATLETYPVTDYGAIQLGEQRFCRVEQAQCQGIASKFMVLWRFKDGEWRIARQVRYAYRQVQ